MGRWVLVTSIYLMATGCGGSDERSLLGAAPDSGGGRGSSGRDAATADGGDTGVAPAWKQPLLEPLHWQPCPLVDGTFGEGEGSGADAGSDAAADMPMAECAETRMPLFHEGGGGETIAYFVKRLPAREPSRGQLWLLSGGPGQSGAVWAYFAARWAEHAPDLDIYMPDHRGTGRSDKLDCEQAKQFIPLDPRRCAAEVATVPNREGFRPTEAAFDVAQLMFHTSRGAKVFAYGGSYGGYWLHRLLQVAPGLLEAAVFDGSASPVGRESPASLEASRESAGRHLLALCADDPSCAGRFESVDADDIIARMSTLAEQCALVLSSDEVAKAKAALGQSLDRFQLKKLVPAAIFHFLACTEADRAWFDAFVAETRRTREDLGADFANGLNSNIALSELLGEPVSASELDRLGRAWLFGVPAQVAAVNEVAGTFPAYDPDRFMGNWASSPADILILHGDLDQHVPVETGVTLAEHFDAANQRFVRFPTGGHVVTAASHDYDDEISCGEHMLFQFLRDSTAPVDTTCVDETPPLDFHGDPDLVRGLSGLDDAWQTTAPMP